MERDREQRDRLREHERQQREKESERKQRPTRDPPSRPGGRGSGPSSAASGGRGGGRGAAAGAGAATRALTDDQKRFVEAVKEAMSEDAAHHMAAIVPDHVLARAVRSADSAYVVEGRRAAVENRRDWIRELRGLLQRSLRGYITMFFDTESFRVYMIADGQLTSCEDFKELLQSDEFIEKFGEFDAESVHVIGIDRK